VLSFGGFDALERDRYGQERDVVWHDCRKVRAVFIDVDGVLTDGLKYYSDNGDQAVSFNVKDGVAFALLMKAGVIPIVISANKTRAVEHRMLDLEVQHYILGCEDKLDAAQEILRSLNLSPDDTAVIGDDLVDLPLFQYCGLSVAPSDAANDILQVADIVLKRKGGDGVLREFYEWIRVTG